MFDIATRQVDIVLPLETEVTPVIEAGGHRMNLREMTTGLLAAICLIFVTANANAAKGAVCKSNNKGDISHTGTDGSDCEADAITGGKSKATAKSGGSAEASSDTHGKSSAIATGEGTADSTADEGAKATAKASGQGTADAAAFGAGGKCTATATASTSGTAEAQCEAGGFARATATNGGTAQAFDDAPPMCSPGPAPGTATVQSSGGNC
ncbi:MAG TPA: DUF6764 family protein [Candidatus Binatus sp.]|nr:DUF6764 family protein [Candidatus Binatus sp.]